MSSPHQRRVSCERSKGNVTIRWLEAKNSQSFLLANGSCAMQKVHVQQTNKQTTKGAYSRHAVICRHQPKIFVWLIFTQLNSASATRQKNLWDVLSKNINIFSKWMHSNTAWDERMHSLTMKWLVTHLPSSAKRAEQEVPTRDKTRDATWTRVLRPRQTHPEQPSR